MAWYGTMCNPRAPHPASYDSVIVEGGISEADVVCDPTGVVKRGTRV